MLAYHTFTFNTGWMPVQSTNLRAVRYTLASFYLEIEFRGGRVYSYDGVPPDVYAGLMAAGSKGRYFYWNIRKKYPYRRLK